MALLSRLRIPAAYAAGLFIAARITWMCGALIAASKGAEAAPYKNVTV